MLKSSSSLAGPRVRLIAIMLSALVAGLTSARAQQGGDVEIIHVQGNVHMIVGSGANIAVQVGEDGVLVVDTGLAPMAEKVVAAIRRLSPGPIRWIINTSGDPDHTGGNEPISRAGKTVNGNAAAIHAHENVLTRMDKSGVPDSAWPLNTYYEPSKDFSFNDEPVVLNHPPTAHTNGDTIVHFRRSDVIVTGDVFMTTTFPVIDVGNGGSVQGSIDALNQLLDLAVPKKQEEGGTYLIPGHGRVSDEADVLEYRDMLVIVRDRIADLIKKGMTLDQVKAARPTLDFDPRYSAPSGPASTAQFVETVYRDLSQKKK
jgi:glyoxylase-like metal-dependent hydrolase (beta-lactamase superfamily II)